MSDSINLRDLNINDFYILCICEGKLNVLSWIFY